MFDYLQYARFWEQHDPDPQDRAELQSIIQEAKRGNSQANLELDERMSTNIRFGTAGLRELMGAGANRMNTAVVTRTTAGLCEVLQEITGPHFSVVIGFDGQQRSRVFSRTVAAVVAGAGGTPILANQALPSAVISYATKALNADAGVSITAAHNMPQYNGYKVYLGGRCSDESTRGVQLTPPWDDKIHDAMMDAPPANYVETSQSGWQQLPSSVIDNFCQAAVELATIDTDIASQLRIVYTPLHGVGGSIMMRVFAEAGFSDVHIVESQAHLDPDFPTIQEAHSRPSGIVPDIDTVLADAVEFGREIDADIIIAHDPDADRTSLTVFDGKDARTVNPDQLGTILGYRIAQHLQSKATDGSSNGVSTPQPVLARSFVSSTQLNAIAQLCECGVEETLTGFKWLARVPHLVFAYEEAHGYCCDPANVPDKDGIGTAVTIASLMAELKAVNRTVDDLLNEITVKTGSFYSSQHIINMTDKPKDIMPFITKLRYQDGLGSINGEPTKKVIDYLLQPTGLPATNALKFETNTGDAIFVRPSGTEPVIKVYIHSFRHVDSSVELDDVARIRHEHQEEHEELHQQIVENLEGLL